jgi:hypothetical protein
LQKRIKSTTPKWFKTVINVGGSLAVVGIAILSAESQVPGFVLPHALEVAAQWFIVAGIVAAAVAKTAKENE